MKKSVINTAISINCKRRSLQDFFGGSLQGYMLVAQKFHDMNKLVAQRFYNANRVIAQKFYNANR